MAKTYIRNPFAESEALYVIMKLIEIDLVRFKRMLATSMADFYGISVSYTTGNHHRKKKNVLGPSRIDDD